MPTPTWEERWHALRHEWLIVAAHRQLRPLHGETYEPEADAVTAYDARCYLCPGNTRVSGAANPSYDGVFVFDNDHPCVAPNAPDVIEAPPLPYASRRANGIARVISYTPRHDLTLARMSVDEIAQIV